MKSTLQRGETRRSALAASHIAKNSCIYLDAGTTTAGAGESSTGTISRWSPDFEITQLLIDAQSVRRDPHTGGTLCRENPLLRGRIQRRVRYATWLSIRPLSPPAAGTQSRGYSPLMRTRLPSRRPSARSAREASCCATVRNTIRWPRLWRYLDPVHHHHYRPASLRCRRRSYRPHACEVLRAGCGMPPPG